jgi:hypothetical protein
LTERRLQNYGGMRNRVFLINFAFSLSVFLFVPGLLSVSQAQTEGTTADRPEFSFELTITQDKYVLKMHETFSLDVSLTTAVDDLRSGDLLMAVSPKIYTVTKKTVTENTYQQTMGVIAVGVKQLKSIAYKSALISDCTEDGDSANTKWHRHCKLRTDIGDGGQSMNWKYDDVQCRQASIGQPLVCDFDIEGSAKAIYVGGFKIQSAPQLALHGKYEALRNFGRTWFFTQTGSVSPVYSNGLFDASTLGAEIHQAFKDGLKAVRTAKSQPQTLQFHVTNRFQM